MLAALPIHKFSNPDVTAKGERRASVALQGLRTLWFNTGTLCNIACANCYIESTPRNDRLAYLTRAEARTFLVEARERHPELEEIGFTGGEPFMNPQFIGMLEDALEGGWRVLVLTNAMRPLQRLKPRVAELQARYGDRLSMRVSLDHYTCQGHEAVRGPRSWTPAIEGLRWLSEQGVRLAAACRLIGRESEDDLRRGFDTLFRTEGIRIDAVDPAGLVLFPEMDANADVPEITEDCWGILGKSQSSVMCASSRMVVKHRGADGPSVVACTLLPYDAQFDLGTSLAQASTAVKLNHPHCAKFCVLGGASCSG